MLTRKEREKLIEVKTRVMTLMDVGWDSALDPIRETIDEILSDDDELRAEYEMA